MFNLSIHNTVLRFYLMMFLSIIAVYTGQSWLIVLAFVVAVSAVLGYQLPSSGEKQSGQIKRMEERSSRKAA